jgi:hypothetical protein
VAEDPARLSALQQRVEEAEREAAEALRALREAEAREANLSERLRNTSKALIDANQELAQAPLLKHRLAEMYDQKAGLEAKLQEVLHSRSWQTTEVLRRISRALKLPR